MRRREFIRLFGGAAVAWPLAALAQDRVVRIGLLTAYSENDPLSQPWIATFVQGLSELGWSVGRNLQIDYRWGSANVEHIKQFAKELISLKPNVILAGSTPVTAALQRETTDIPIVFVIVSDPVGDGFVTSLARPGGNITGFINFENSMGGKWLVLLKEAAPRLKRVKAQACHVNLLTVWRRTLAQHGGPITRCMSAKIPLQAPLGRPCAKVRRRQGFDVPPNRA